MIKRISCFIMAIMISLLLSSTTLAESFSIRNGISFGMSVEEVKAKESDLNFEELSEEDYNRGFYPYEITLNAKITMLGNNNTELFYSFNNDALEQIGMFLRGSKKADVDTLFKALTEKYGQYTKHITNYKDASEYASNRVGDIVVLGGEALEWIINDEKGIISICLILDYYNQSQIYYRLTPNSVLQKDRDRIDELKNGI